MTGPVTHHAESRAAQRRQPLPDALRRPLLVTLDPHGHAVLTDLEWRATTAQPGPRIAHVPGLDLGSGAPIWACVEYPAGCAVAPHAADGIVQYIHVSSGTLDLTVGDVRTSLRAGDCLVLAPGLLHGWQTGDEPAALVVFALPPPAT